MPSLPDSADSLSLSALLLRVAQHAARDDGPLRVEPVGSVSWSITESSAAQLAGLDLVRVVTHRNLLLLSLTPRTAAALDRSTPAGATTREKLVQAVVSQHAADAAQLLRRLARD